jgi:hypothetical protein
LLLGTPALANAPQWIVDVGRHRRQEITRRCLNVLASRKVRIGCGSDTDEF